MAQPRTSMISKCGTCQKASTLRGVGRGGAGGRVCVLKRTQCGACSSRRLAGAACQRLTGSRITVVNTARSTSAKMQKCTQRACAARSLAPHLYRWKPPPSWSRMPPAAIACKARRAQNNNMRRACSCRTQQPWCACVPCMRVSVHCACSPRRTCSVKSAMPSSSRLDSCASLPPLEEAAGAAPPDAASDAAWLVRCGSRAASAVAGQAGSAHREGHARAHRSNASLGV